MTSATSSLLSLQMLPAVTEAVHILAQYEEMCAKRPDLSFDVSRAATPAERVVKDAVVTLGDGRIRLLQAIFATPYVRSVREDLQPLHELVERRRGALMEAAGGLVTPILTPGRRAARCELSGVLCRELVKVQLDNSAVQVHAAYANALQLVQFVGSLPERLKCIGTLPNSAAARITLVSHTAESVHKLCSLFGCDPFLEVCSASRPLCG